MRDAGTSDKLFLLMLKHPHWDIQLYNTTYLTQSTNRFVKYEKNHTNLNYPFNTTLSKIARFLIDFCDEEEKNGSRTTRLTVAQMRRKTFKNYFVNKQQQIGIILVRSK